jgi:hypothetical protein
VITLLDEHYAPTTSTIGLLNAPVDDCAVALRSWRHELGLSPRQSALNADLGSAITTLEPLVGGARPRELLIEVDDGWTAYFDCSLRGTDAPTAVGYLTVAMAVSGIVVETVPHQVGRADVPDRLGSCQFQLFGPTYGPFLNYVRTVALVNDGHRWIFEATGKSQWYEETERYRAKRVRDRFNSEMLRRYCQALGVQAFAGSAYGPRAVLTTSDTGEPAGLVLTLEQARAWLGIRPGTVQDLPG